MITTPPITGNEDLDSFLYNVVSEISSGTSGSGITYNSTNGEITNAAGDVIGYIYRYIHIKYADDNVGTGMANVPLNKQYYGLRNSDSTTESNNPADYRWIEVAGSFGSSRSLFYKTTGNRTVRFDADTAAEDYTWVVDPGIAIDLDVIVLPQTISFNQVQDAAITELKIAAGAVTAAKTNIASIEAATGFLIANSVGTTQITDDAISSQKIQANSIVAGKIAANAVTASTIEANAITAIKINAGAVTAGKITVSELSAISANMGTITAGTITANTLTAGTATVANGKIFALAGTVSVSGNIVSAGSFGSVNQSGSGGVLGYSLGSNTWGVAGMGDGSSLGGVFANAYNASINSYRTTAWLGSNIFAADFRYNLAPTKIVQICNASYGVQLFGSSVGPFTGAHDGLIPKTANQPSVGDIVVDVSVYAKPNINDSLCVNALANTSNQKGVVGVFSVNAGEGHVPSALAKSVEGTNGTSYFIVDPIYTDIDDYTMIVINSLGEGLINVCGESGNIEVGDLIVTSSIAGKGMKQSDDLIRNITVAKSRENITFNSPTEIKQIACIYLAG